jgi:hypothetical protein
VQPARPGPGYPHLYYPTPRPVPTLNHTTFPYQRPQLLRPITRAVPPSASLNLAKLVFIKSLHP